MAFLNALPNLAEKPRTSAVMQGTWRKGDVRLCGVPLAFRRKSLSATCAVNSIDVAARSAQRRRRRVRLWLHKKIGAGPAGRNSAQPCAMADAGHRHVRLSSAAKPLTSTTAAARTTSLRIALTRPKLLRRPHFPSTNVGQLSCRVSPARPHQRKTGSFPNAVERNQNSSLSAPVTPK
jgi:hypothetical protein